MDVKLYIIRHGKAERDSESGRDEDRALTDRGKRQATWMGERLAAEEEPPVRVLMSPAVRARQTGELVAAGLGVEPEIAQELSLSSSASRVVELIETLQEGPVALVGHNPTLSTVVEALVLGPGGGHGVELRTGEGAVVQFAGPQAIIGGAEMVALLRLVE